MDFAWPRDPAPLAAFLVGAALLLAPPSITRRIDAGSPRRFAWIASLAAAALSALYVAVYLRGGPRIVDASSYWLEARAMAGGDLSFPVGEVPASVMGRFLVRDTLGGGEHAAVLFPPGYPAVLALGFLVGAPMIVGPVLAAALTWLVVDLTRQLAPRVGLDAPERAARVAGVLAVSCAALRYHTADTMSHGLAAVCVVGGLAAACRVRAGDAVHAPLGVGLAWGWLLATRPVSALAAVPLLWLAAGRPSLPALARMALGVLPGAAMLVLQQRAATGAWLASSQSLYYALSDGPPGCFRLGFGDGIGCLGEHGDFVEHNLPHGYGAWAAIKTSARRLVAHALDPLGAEPLVLLVLAALVRAGRHPRTRPLAFALPAWVLAYAPFYFDGNYPGGGARFFADVLPLELVALGLAIEAWAPALAERRPWLGAPARLASLVLGLSLVGFAFRGQVEHARLRDREGGRPMWRAADRGDVKEGLVFVDTDHGFALGFAPRARADRGGLEVARLRGDAHDRWLWELRGRPPAFLHTFDVSTGAARFAPFEPPPATHLEAEALWPPIAQQGGWALPSWYDPDGCASGRRQLVFHAEGAVGPSPDAMVRLALPARIAGRLVSPRVTPGDGEVTVTARVDGAPGPVWSTRRDLGRGPCQVLPAQRIRDGRRVELEIVFPAPAPERRGVPAEPPALDAILLVDPP